MKITDVGVSKDAKDITGTLAGDPSVHRTGSISFRGL